MKLHREHNHHMISKNGALVTSKGSVQTAHDAVISELSLVTSVIYGTSPRKATNGKPLFINEEDVLNITWQNCHIVGNDMKRLSYSRSPPPPPSNFIAGRP